eukprot:TRINITY_DN19888_c0_g1_i1.p1 TRINITY_DN19888_c0_g1~~TRINITY_DN19888_c0_g1_i1.p1  ORF type:complete len:354 (-),score=77.98 TRINITY_DN19888_c0_g1_i1:217-1251(-)
MAAENVKLFSFAEEIAEPVKKLAQTAWHSKGKLVHDVKAYVLLFCSMVCSMPGRALQVLNNPKLHALLEEEEDPQALAAVVAGSGGALCLGSVGAVVGAVAGGAAGLCLGALPAIFTFGISLPVGAFLGGTSGALVGVAAGSSAGFAGGASSGLFVASFRWQIRNALVYTAAKLYGVYDVLVLRPVATVQAAQQRVRKGAQSSMEYTRAKARATKDFVTTTAADRHVQVTVAGAGLGAASLGTAGAAGGACMGGAAGALVGLVPAVFTFGLSIPVGAFVGGSAGLILGGAAGASTGFAGGAAAAYVGYRQRGLPAAALSFAGQKAQQASQALGLAGRDAAAKGA